jgi:hypothetical protein
MLAIRARAYPIGARTMLPSKVDYWPYPHSLRVILSRDKHSSLLRKLVNYGRKMFYSLGPRPSMVLDSGIVRMMRVGM